MDKLVRFTDCNYYTTIQLMNHHNITLLSILSGTSSCKKLGKHFYRGHEIGYGYGLTNQNGR